MLRTSAFLLGTLLACASADAQCTRPSVPRGGLAIEQRSVERVTYSDAVVTEGRLLVPTDPPPSCGWPLVVYVHSLGSQRDQDRSWQERVAAQGYAVWAYDIRGQAAARLLNITIGTTLYGPTERFDLAEQIAHVRATHVGLVSPSRVAVLGDSQGGIHGWMAAAQSGRALSVPGRGVVTFPVISCVVGADFVAEPTLHRVRGGTVFSAPFLDLCTIDPLTLPFQIDPAFAAGVVQHFAAGDPAGLESFLRGEPGRVVDDELRSCTVPILFHHAWHDSICGIGPILDAVRGLPASTPFRLVVSTVGHAVPRNDYELKLKRELSLRWLERFLWDETNQVDEEARFVLAWMPLDPLVHADPASLWEHAHLDALPTPEATPLRLYTTDLGTLDETEPTTNGTPTRIEHVVAPGFDAQVWLNDQTVRSVDEVLLRIPMSERTFDRTLGVGLDLVGSPVVQLQVTPDGPRFQLAALLSARLPGQAEFRMLTHWGAGVVDATPAASRAVAIELSPIAARLPAGTELRLTLRNHWIPEAPHLRGMVAVPPFDTFHLDVAHGQGVDASFVELPVLTESVVALVASDLSADADAPGRTDFRFDAGVGRAGWSYLLVAGASGQIPGIDLPGGQLPVHLDDLTVAFARSVGSRELLGFAGVLDQDGRGFAALELTHLGALPPAMVGFRLTFATWVYRSPVDFSGVPSNPVDLTIR